jgi:hypothetical protein
VPLGSPPPAEPALPISNCGQLLANALIDAGIVGIDEQIEQPILNRAFTQVNWLLAQWARKRWLCYALEDYAITSNGANTYTVGLNQDVNINPRPDRLEYAFLRFTQQIPSGGTPVDIPIYIIPSKEDYSRITVKFIGTLPWQVFYDPQWPVGILRFWPIPQPTIYEMHVGFKVVLPRFQSLQQQINFPPEYEAALNWCLVKRLRAVYQMPADPAINALARDALNTIRLGNTAMSTLVMPRALRTRNRAYDYRGDSDSQ